MYFFRIRRDSHPIHEIRAGIKCFFVCSVYGSAPKIAAVDGCFEASWHCDPEVTPVKNFCTAGVFEHESAWRKADEGGSRTRAKDRIGRRRGRKTDDATIAESRNRRVEK